MFCGIFDLDTVMIYFALHFD